jgi:anti-sigma regulatory factor (Ser/Thr protein kinase)
MAQGQLLRVELPSDPSMLCVVRGAMERLTEAFGFSAPEVRSVTRAVDEALTNIMRHSYGGALDRPIELSCLRVAKSRAASGEGFEIRLIDYGPKIDPAKLRGRKLEEIKPGGLGLHFIRQSMDIVEFRRARGTNVLRLVKYLSPEGQKGD